MQTMTTYGTEEATTTWIYDDATGHLTRKQYHDENGTNYTYTAAGHLETRIWERSVTTEYTYTKGLLTAVDYTDATPALTYTHDRLGRVLTVTRGGSAHFTYTYDNANFALETETQTDPTYSQRLLTRKTDDFGRPEGYLLGTTGDPDLMSEVTYTYDDAGRFESLTYQRAPGSGTPPAAETFTYDYRYTLSGSYHTASPGTGTESHIPFTLTSPVHTAKKTYETTRHVLRSIDNQKTAGSVLRSGYTYTVNDLGQRTGLTQSGSVFGGTPDTYAWQYNSRGEVVSADSTLTSTKDRYFEFDAIGNRIQSRTNTATGSGGTLTSYFANDDATGPGANPLNQYAAIQTGATTRVPVHDEDGNLEEDGIKWNYTWDAENRLIRAETYPGDSSPRQIRYHYDHLSRCFLRQTYYWNATTGVWYVATTNRWVYDGWNRIALLSPSGAVTEEYLWGLDLSGSMQGAGGVGGLLLWSRTYDSGASWQSYYPCYDGNGNVTELLDASGERAAQWEYDPFGNTVSSAPAPANWASPVLFFPYRFSTKPLDPDTRLYYYGYRYYDPNTGRWPSRDPIAERGGLNLYGFIRNNGLAWIDYLGLTCYLIVGPDQGNNPKPIPPEIRAPNGPDVVPDDTWDELKKAAEEAGFTVIDGANQNVFDKSLADEKCETLIYYNHGNADGSLVPPGQKEGSISPEKLFENRQKHTKIIVVCCHWRKVCGVGNPWVPLGVRPDTGTIARHDARAALMVYFRTVKALRDNPKPPDPNNPDDMDQQAADALDELKRINKISN